MFIKIAKHSCKWFLTVSALLIIAFAFLISMTRIALPFIRHKNHYAAYWLSEVLNKPVDIQSLSVGWDGFDPVLNFKNVIIRNSEQDIRTALKIHKISISINLFRSLLHAKLLPGDLFISGSQVDLYQQSDKHFQIKGIIDIGGVKQKSNFVYMNSVFTWLLSQSRVAMSHIQVRLYLLSGREMILHNLAIKTDNKNNKHQVLINAQLGFTGNSYLQGVFNISKVNLNSEQFDATGYLLAKHVALSVWFNNPLLENKFDKMRVKRGVGNVETWMNWSQGDLQSWHSVIQANRVAFSFPDNEEVNLPALQINLFWQRKSQLVFDFDINAQMMQIAGLYPWNHPLKFGRVSMSAELQNQNQTWHIVVPRVYLQKQHAVVSGAFSLDLPKTGTAVINSFFIFRLNALAKLNSLIPVNGMPKKLGEWLGEAFTAGYVPYGVGVIHGPLNDFPFADHKGIFHISMRLKNVGLHYAPGWPNLNKLNGKLIFSDDGMRVVNASAFIQKVKMKNINASIPHWEDSILKVEATSKLNVADGFYFLKTMPLKSAETFTSFNPTGVGQLDLHLQIPLKNSELSQKVYGTVITNDVHFPLPAWNLNLDHVSGNFSFTNDALFCSRFTANMNGQPFSASLATINREKQDAALLFNLAGGVDLTDIENRFHWPSFLASNISGSLRYRALLKVGMQEKERGRVSLHLVSDLLGLQSRLPYGLNKNKGQAAGLNLHVTAQDNHHVKFDVQFDHVVKTHFVLVQENLEWTLANMQMQLEKNRVMNGLLSQMKATWFLAKQNGVLLLKSPNITGRCYVPRIVDHPWYCNLSTLKMPVFHLKKTGQSVDPNKIPPMHLSVNHFYFNKKALGQLTVDWKKIKDGLKINLLELHNLHFVLLAQGSWLQKDNKNKTEFGGKLGTGDWGNILARWHLTRALVGGNGWLNFSLAWDDSPFAMDIKKLHGNLSVDLNHGRIIKLSAATESKLGLGKFLNVLSFESLPANLLSGFSLLNKKGFSFDELKGPLIISRGVAKFNDLKLNGPLAWVSANGSVFVLQKRYDMKIHVAPNITASLPLIVGIVGGPIAGVVAWVADKVVAARLIAKMASSTKHVAGSWAHPKITKIPEPKVTA